MFFPPIRFAPFQLGKAVAFEDKGKAHPFHEGQNAATISGSVPLAQPTNTPQAGYSAPALTTISDMDTSGSGSDKIGHQSGKQSLAHDDSGSNAL
jgi:hypothetical protein